MGPQQTWRAWLRAASKDNPTRIGFTFQTLGAITGQDARALEAIAACWELYAGSDDAGRRAALDAVRSLLPAVQRGCHVFARALIARSLDWHDRERVWPLVAPLRSVEPVD